MRVDIKVFLYYLVFLQVVRGQISTYRPDVCGDLTIQGFEQCDDGNNKNGDGCNEFCKLESGYMCYGGVRTSTDEYGVMIENDVVSQTNETCTNTDICQTSTEKWSPELYAYDANTLQQVPPSGYYCKDYCKSFPVVDGYEMNDNCQLQDINECKKSILCDVNAFCYNLVPNENDGKKYTCLCDSMYFTTAAEGQGCSASGVEIVLVVSRPTTDGTETSDVEALRNELIDAMQVNRTYLSGSISAEIIKEGVLEYPVSFLSTGANPGFENTNLFQMKIRLAIENTIIPAFTTYPIFQDSSALRGIIDDSENFRLHTRSVCSNDKDRFCILESDCVSGGVCVGGLPDVDVAILNAGGSSAPIVTSSSGMELISIEYSPADTAWKARVRYDDTVPDTLNVLYLSHVEGAIGPEELASFNVDEFPCQVEGVGDLQKRRSDTVCCLQPFDNLYTTPLSFGSYIRDTDGDLGHALYSVNDDTCSTKDHVPGNNTIDILDGSLDFVHGPFARMTRSYATLDTVVTRGYKDVLLFLAEEDMRQFGGVESVVPGGFSLRFFIGMAHIKGLSSDRIRSSFSQVNVDTTVTDTFMFTTGAQTDDTFVKDINVDLIQVKKPGVVGDYKKFARVQMTVPETVTADNIQGIIPFSSAVASVGNTLETATNMVYPCLLTYAGVKKESLDDFLAAQS